jgi:ribosome maturation protein SDO1
MIEKALQELSGKKVEEGQEGAPQWHGVKESKSAKAQSLEAIKALVHWQIIPIARARMRLRITGNKKCKETVIQNIEQIEEEQFSGAGEWECVGFVEPGKYKLLVDLVGAETKGRGRVEILDTAVSFSIVLEVMVVANMRHR